MKVYTYYTESHKNMFDNYFSKTIEDLEIKAFIGEQECKSGEYYSTGWKTTTMKKVDVFINAVKENMGDIFVFSDVDIQFFGPIKDSLLQELGDFDIAIQNDYNGGLCSGFFICRGNERTLNMFESMKNNGHLYAEDQYALNMNLHLCKVTVLSTRFWTFGQFGGQWKGQIFDIPENILMHHANWTEGINNKIKLLDIVREKYNLRKQVQNSNNYQEFLNDFFKEFRQTPSYPVYPPYHTGSYIEQYFFDFFNKSNINNDIYYLPIDWTTSYIENNNLGLLQEKLISLDRTKKYFTVSQHDDAIKEYLPKDTIKFCAGGNAGGIPIPLVCSPIPDNLKVEAKRDIFCSFVGSITHQIRQSMVSVLNNNPKYVLQYKGWSDKVSNNDLNNFINITSRSIFTLCPRGYGKNSFRMYEAMQLGSIPVYIYDDDWRPFKDVLNWDDFSVSIHISQLQNLDKILSSIDDKNIKQKQEKLIYYYDNYFSLEGLSKQILNKIDEKNNN